MYSKIPFASGWSGTQLVETLHALLNNVTSPASLPHGVVATATIDNTIPHGWTLESYTSGVIQCNAPIIGRNNARKYAKIESTGSVVEMRVGDTLAGSAIRVGAANITKAARIWLSGQVATSVPILLHVSITPTRFITAIERLSNTNPIVSSNQNHCICGVSDVIFDDAHYSNVGSLLPFALLDRLESANTSDVSVSLPKVFSAGRSNPPVVNYPTSEFVVAGLKSNLPHVPVGGRLWRSGASSFQQLYELGVSPKSDDPVIGTFPDIRITSSNLAPQYTEHTTNGKTYVALSMGSTNATTLLLPKE
jgi:hypothetical protein